MKKIVLILLLTFPILGVSQEIDWYTSLDAAKRLALIQDKLILMVWEESTLYPEPVKISNDRGGSVVIENMFKNEYINNLIWEHFIPVVVNESQYTELYEEIKGKRSKKYIDKFNDDSIKILDANGTIINRIVVYDNFFLNMTTFVERYALNTSILKGELTNYSKQKDFYTTFRLASKYIDYGIYVNKEVRAEIIKVSSIYLDEASTYLNDTIENKQALLQRMDLLRIKQSLVLNKPRKALRQLKRMDPSEIIEANTELVDFLYYTAYGLLKDEKNASTLRSKLSLVNLKKATQIINKNF
ncbi:hypothetical protein [Psychroserpens luteolus]|uniref:hypothetical protein n=1 Tax=Psychroserpens luteolus TaxID=2855840 RepID=UPI001E4C18EA|nr:hypothetical protein [Psychroserpens luteolus]MCD2260083.1 hypothetical protein [Psychroserpens luteolus]